MEEIKELKVNKRLEARNKKQYRSGTCMTYNQVLRQLLETDVISLDFEV